MRLRLILAFSLIVIITVCSMVVIARFSAANEVRTFMFRGGMLGGDYLVNNLERYYRLNRTWQGVENILSNLTTGQSAGRYGQGKGAIRLNRLRLLNVQKQLVFDSQSNSQVERIQDLELSQAIPLVVDNQTVGYLMLDGGMNFTRADESQLVSRINRAAITAGVFAGLISLLLALIMAYGLLRPVTEVTHAAQNLSQGDLTQRVTIRGNDELATLGKTFNQMAESLQSALKSRRAMTSNIAHELRNPLAVQRANIEALMDGIYPLTPDSLDPLLDQNLLLTRLVDDLRTLALADAGELEWIPAQVDPIALVHQIASRFKPQADAEKIDLQVFPSLENNGGLTAYLDSGRIEQILGNLLSNAFRYTPPGGRVWLEIECLPDTIRITVQDSGKGIPEDSLPYIFERFYRAERSRSRVEGGTGLGLAIARQLAQAHGGTLTASNCSQGGACFTLTIPTINKEHKNANHST